METYRMTTTRETGRELGALIRQTRIDRKMTIRELARRSQVPRSTILRLEQGAIARPRLDLVAPIVFTLDMPSADIVAVLGHSADHDLPSIEPYLQARYHHLPPALVTEVRHYLEAVAKREGIDLELPPPRLDE